MNASYLTSLADVQHRHAELKAQIRELEDEIAVDYAQLFAPPPPTDNKLEVFVQTASRAWSIADGVMTGYKLMRRLGKVTSWFSKRKR